MSKQSTAPSDINARERMNQALSLRKAGATLDQIAKACGYASKSGAHKAIRRALSELPRENAEELRTLQLAQLNELLQAHWLLAKKDVNRAHLCLKILGQQAQLLGLNIEPADAIAPRIIIREVPSYLRLTEPSTNGSSPNGASH